MKNRFATYLAVLVMAFMALSCSNDGDETLSPYAYIKAFSIGDIKSSYPEFTESGEDTLVVKTISGSSLPFTINQATCEIFNKDSLPFSTDVSKVVMDMAVEGSVKIYNETDSKFESLYTTDSIDCTYPRVLRVTSLDGNYYQDYTVAVNVHKVDPERLVWKAIETPAGIAPEKAIEFNGEMLLLGKESATPCFASMPLNGVSSWAVAAMSGIPESADFATAIVFNGLLYALADGDMYASSDAVNWTCVSQGNGFVAIIGASDEGGCIWVANAGNIYRSTDGNQFDVVQALPDNFPLYGVSAMSGVMAHNKNIIRYTLVGYPTSAKDSAPQVWSILSTENRWVKYDNVGNPYPCPSLAGLTVLRYDNFLYAFGGKGVVAEEETEAFASFYVSKDNGIVWKAMGGYYQLLPKAMKGADVPFVATVDSNNYMWIITTDSNAGAWRGILNRLGFKK